MDALRYPAEIQYAEELETLRKNETYDVPEGWKLSPRSVLTYICGGKSGGKEIVPKVLGNRRLVEMAIATLLTDRALLLIGEPGTAKSWLSEHLAAAIHGDSTLTVQGTAGTSEEQIRYTWNYAMLLANGPSDEALVKTPIYRAMELGTIARFEEITRCASEVQDALISLLSEKCIIVPELGTQVYAKRGFSIIATANTRDRGVNELSAALKRRFNTIILPPPPDLNTEVEIVTQRVRDMGKSLRLNIAPPKQDAVTRVVTLFRELRAGQTLDGSQKVKSPASVLSTAEAISTLVGSMAFAASFGGGTVDEDALALSLQGAILKDEDAASATAWREYLENIALRRDGDWKRLARACKALLP